MTNEEPISISLTDVDAVLMNEAALQDRSGFDLSMLWLPAIGLAVLGCAIWGVIWYLRHRQKALLANDPENLFHELCVAHSLNWSERRALLKLAKVRKIANPCLLVMDAALWLDENDSSINRSQANKLCRIHRSLFEPVTPAS